MGKNATTGEDRRAAIVCSHIAVGKLPILRAVRDEPTMAEDSGWQFLCGTSENEDPDEAQVWLIAEVLKYDRSMIPFIGHPPGTVLTRRNRGGVWEVGRKR